MKTTSRSSGHSNALIGNHAAPTAGSRFELSPVTNAPTEFALAKAMKRNEVGESKRYHDEGNAAAHDNYKVLQFICNVGLTKAAWEDVPFNTGRSNAFCLAATYLGGGLPALADLEKYDHVQLKGRALATWSATSAQERAHWQKKAPSLVPLMRLLDSVADGAVRISEKANVEVMRYLYPALNHKGLEGLAVALQVFASERAVAVELTAAKGKRREQVAPAPKAARDDRDVQGDRSVAEKNPRRPTALTKAAASSHSRPPLTAPSPRSEGPADTGTIVSKKRKFPLFAAESDDEQKPVIKRSPPAVHHSSTAFSLPLQLEASQRSTIQRAAASEDGEAASSSSWSGQQSRMLSAAPSSPVSAMFSLPNTVTSQSSAGDADDRGLTPPRSAQPERENAPEPSHTMAVFRAGFTHTITVPEKLLIPLMQVPAPTRGMGETHRATINKVDGLFSLATLRALVFGGN